MDSNILAQLKLILGPWSSYSLQYRCWEVSLARLRNGYTHLTLMASESPPVYSLFQVCLSVFHILVKCSAYAVTRNRFFPSLRSVPSRESQPFLLSESLGFSFSTLSLRFYENQISFPILIRSPLTSGQTSFLLPFLSSFTPINLSLSILKLTHRRWVI